MSSKSISTEEMSRRYEFIVNNAKEFMTLINSDYIYEAANDSYCFAHNKKRKEIIGKTAANIWGKEIFDNVIHKCLDECLSGSEVHYQEWFEFPSLGRRYFDVRYYPYYNKEAVVTHVVLVTHDITQRKIAEEELEKHRDHLEEMVEDRTNELEKSNRQLQNEIIERKRLERKMEQLIKDLKTALTNVKRLRGLIPICASCKKIRDDEGYWKEVESYIREHSDAEFTHGICPDCMKKLYPQYYDKDKSG
ncbi:MAG: hypothetical protein DRP89_03805 [Candidatus Neomarinimicrobiota bacterium]|nr:MAG: hypothetical protein DRP89_03805 [Candidatus Neomarinimicrobiota bacterium]